MEVFLKERTLSLITGTFAMLPPTPQIFCIGGPFGNEFCILSAL
jgi:hypothetical protein